MNFKIGTVMRRMRKQHRRPKKVRMYPKGAGGGGSTMRGTVAAGGVSPVSIRGMPK